MKNALLAVKGGMSLCKEAQEFGIPKQTISDRVNDRWKSTKPGQETALLEEEENSLIHYIKYIHGINRPPSVHSSKQ